MELVNSSRNVILSALANKKICIGAKKLADFKMECMDKHRIFEYANEKNTIDLCLEL